METQTENIPQQANRVKRYWGDRPMGEVRARIKFTNAYDVERFERGEISESDVRRFEVDAVVDTGAIQTVIPQAVADALGVRIRGKRPVRYADSRSEIVGVTFPLIAEIMGRDTGEECLVLGNEVLIGQTMLEKTDLLVDCANARLVPDPKHPDGPVFRV